MVRETEKPEAFGVTKAREDFQEGFSSVKCYKEALQVLGGQR